MCSSDLMARFIEALLPSFGSDNPRALAMAADLVMVLKQPQVEILAVENALSTLTHHVRSVVEEQLEVRRSEERRVGKEC